MGIPPCFMAKDSTGLFSEVPGLALAQEEGCHCHAALQQRLPAVWHEAVMEVTPGWHEDTLA